MARDVLGWRRKFAVIGPSTNTVVQPDMEAMRPPGVTLHYSAITTPNAKAISNESFKAGIDVIGANTMDAVRVAMSLEQVSDSRRDVTGDFRKVTGLATPLPDFESALELSWQAQVTPWWIVQPDLQWVIHPGGRVLDPAHPLAVTPDALVLGLRTAVAL